MLRKKKRPDFDKSEPEFLISTLDRHQDWAVVVCLVGGGQEINTGEAGIGEWIDSLNRLFPDWDVYISSRLTDSEYGAGERCEKIEPRPNVQFDDDLHLAVSMRSFRAEHVSLLVKQLLDLDDESARQTLATDRRAVPDRLARDLGTAKRWVKEHARGSERFGLVVSSQAQRLKPHAIDVRSPMDPVHWFLDGKQDVRSSYYLEDVATEFHVQGLELDWACVTWDADFRYSRRRLGTLVVLRRSLEPHPQVGATVLPQERLSRAAHAGTARHGDRRPTRRYGRPDAQGRVLRRDLQLLAQNWL